MSEAKTLKFSIGKDAGRQLVGLAREKAYYSGTYNDGIAFLFAAGIEDYGICEQILKGKTTLEVETLEDGSQIYNTVDDDWKLPEPDLSDEQMRKEVYEYCNDMRKAVFSGSALYHLTSVMEQASFELRIDLIRELAKTNPRKAYDDMLIVKKLLIDTQTERALIQAAYGGSESAMSSLGVNINDKDEKVKIDKEENKEPSNYSDHINNLAVIIAMNPTSPVAELAMKHMAKQFDFTFKGHEYTYQDSARDQSKCPHCSYEIDGLGMINPVKDADKFKFLGAKKLTDDEWAFCFECKNCFEKFFYHIDAILAQQILYNEITDPYKEE